jgi:hypothetical protein
MTFVNVYNAGTVPEILFGPFVEPEFTKSPEERTVWVAVETDVGGEVMLIELNAE